MKSDCQKACRQLIGGIDDVNGSDKLERVLSFLNPGDAATRIDSDFCDMQHVCHVQIYKLHPVDFLSSSHKMLLRMLKQEFDLHSSTLTRRLLFLCFMN